MVERLRLFLELPRSRERDSTASPLENRPVLRSATPGGGAVPATGTASTADEDVDVTSVPPDNWGFPAARAVIHARRVSDRGADFAWRGGVAHVSTTRPGAVTTSAEPAEYESGGGKE